MRRVGEIPLFKLHHTVLPLLQLLELLRQSLFERVAREQFDQERIGKYIEEILARRRDPHSIVEEIMQALGVGAKRN